MGFVALLVLIVALVLVGVGLALGLIAAAFLATLLGIGVISSSCLIGFHTGRPAVAIQAFLLQCGGLTGIPIGILCAWGYLNFFRNEVGIDGKTITSGAIGGLLAGLILAWSLDLILRKLRVWAMSRLAPPQKKSF